MKPWGRHKFLRTQEAEATKEKVDKLDLITKKLLSSKDIVKLIKRQAIDWEKYYFR